MNQTFPTTPTPVSQCSPATGEVIDLSEACTVTQNYRDAHLNDTRAVFMGRDILNKLLGQDGAIGIRCYFGLNELQQLTLVMVAADASGNDMLEMVADRAVMCPNTCSVKSPLLL